MSWIVPKYRKLVVIWRNRKGENVTFLSPEKLNIPRDEYIGISQKIAVIIMLRCIFPEMLCLIMAVKYQRILVQDVTSEPGKILYHVFIDIR